MTRIVDASWEVDAELAKATHCSNKSKLVAWRLRTADRYFLIAPGSRATRTKVIASRLQGTNLCRPSVCLPHTRKGYDVRHPGASLAAAVSAQKSGSMSFTCVSRPSGPVARVRQSKNRQTAFSPCTQRKIIRLRTSDRSSIAWL
jgi:hypothetical protein